MSSGTFAAVDRPAVCSTNGRHRDAIRCAVRPVEWESVSGAEGGPEAVGLLSRLSRLHASRGAETGEGATVAAATVSTQRDRTRTPVVIRYPSGRRGMPVGSVTAGRALSDIRWKVRGIGGTSGTPAREYSARSGSRSTRRAPHPTARRSRATSSPNSDPGVSDDMGTLRSHGQVGGMQ